MCVLKKMINIESYRILLRKKERNGVNALPPNGVAICPRAAARVWSEKEEEVLRQGVAEHGRQWNLIAESLKYAQN